MFRPMSRFTLMVCGVLTLGSAAVPAAAQQPAGTGPVQTPPMRSIQPAGARPGEPTPISGLFPQDSVRPRRGSYTWEGAAIGAGILGTLGAVMLGGLCGDSDIHESCVGSYAGGAAMGIVIGGVVGGMIGSAVHKGDGPAPAGARVDRPSAYDPREPD